MNLQFYINKLEKSEIYKKFMEKNQNAFLCSGFFAIDKKGIDNKQHLDFFVPEEKDSKKGKMFSFQMEGKINLIPLDELERNFENKDAFPIPQELNVDYDFDFDEIEKIVEKKMEENKIKNEIHKYLFSLQKVDDKDYLIGTVFISLLGLLKINISLPEKKIIVFEKRSIFDIIKKG